jgi:hypothetical protein
MIGMMMDPGIVSMVSPAGPRPNPFDREISPSDVILVRKTGVPLILPGRSTIRTGFCDPNAPKLACFWREI